MNATIEITQPDVQEQNVEYSGGIESALKNWFAIIADARPAGTVAKLSVDGKLLAQHAW